jgi:hypothetical protein
MMLVFCSCKSVPETMKTLRLHSETSPTQRIFENSPKKGTPPENQLKQHTQSVDLKHKKTGKSQPPAVNPLKEGIEMPQAKNHLYEPCSERPKCGLCNNSLRLT